MSNPVRESVESLFNQLVTTLPKNCASSRTRIEKHSSMVELLPENPNAATISVIVPEDKKEAITLVAGKGSFFEIPPSGHRYTDLPLVDEIRAISEAVIAGRLDESVTFNGEEVLQGTGTLDLPPAVTVRWRQISFLSHLNKRKKRFQYEPYCSVKTAR